MKMKLYRRIRILFLSVLLIVPAILAGCGKGPAAGSQVGSSPAEASSSGKDGVTQTDVVPDVPKESYPEFFSVGEPAFLIPGLQDALVPQGMCRIPSRSELVFSCYSSESGGSSMLLVVDEKSGSLKKAVRLLNEDGSAYTGHAGGVAASGKNLWVVTGGYAQRLPIGDLSNAGPQGEVKFTDRFDTGTRASFTNCVDGVLWVGDFFKSGGSYNTDESHHMTAPDGSESHAWIAGFKLDPSSPNELAPSSSGSGSGPVAPDYVLSIPDEIQGMTKLKSGEFVLSRSYGRNNKSSLLLYRGVLDSNPDRTVWINGKEVPLWFLDSETSVKSITAPPMLESLERADGNVLALFESASDPYRDTALDPVDDVMRLDLRQSLKESGEKS